MAQRLGTDCNGILTPLGRPMVALWRALYGAGWLDYCFVYAQP